MKRRALPRHLQQHGCAPVRERGSHSIWSKPKTGRKEAVPWHNEIKIRVEVLTPTFGTFAFAFV